MTKLKKIIFIFIAAVCLIWFFNWGLNQNSKQDNQTSGSPPTPTEGVVMPDVIPTSWPSTNYLDDKDLGYRISKIQNTYFIYINASPFESTRLSAEQAFLSQLKLTPDAACRLDVRITTPYRINPNESNQTYSLSFCSNP